MLLGATGDCNGSRRVAEVSGDDGIAPLINPHRVEAFDTVDAIEIPISRDDPISLETIHYRDVKQVSSLCRGINVGEGRRLLDISIVDRLDTSSH